MNDIAQNNIEEINALNNDIREAEKGHNSELIKARLAEDFIFRRANNTFADKTAYLLDIQNEANSYTHLGYINVDTKLDDNGKFAISTITLDASGLKASKAFSGKYKNIRFFRKNENEQWELYAWYNEKIQDGIITLIPAGDCSINYLKETGSHFENDVYRESQPYLPSSPEVRAFYVKFENGGRTKWHYHTEMQILVVKDGDGFVEEKGHPSFDIFPGDRIYIPRNVWHRHGAKEGKMMVHLAINVGETKWEGA